MGAPAQRIDACVRRLRAGGLVAFPTETVYGLGAIATDEHAVASVFALKGRPARNPLIVHVDGAEMARGYCARWPDEAQRLADAFWPGPLTLVLPRSERVPGIVTGGGETVALRCPDHPLALALIEQLGEGIVGPSANPSGGVSPTCAEHVRDSFTEEQVDVLDGGACVAGIESTVLDLTRRPPRVLRPGVIGPERIAAVLGAPVAGFETRAGAGKEIRSPGLLGPHYAPRATTRLFADREGLGRLREQFPGRAVVIARDEIESGTDAQVLRLPPDARGFAAGVYAALRRADALEPALIAAQRPPETGGNEEEQAIWAAVLERLTRAADAG